MPREWKEKEGEEDRDCDGRTALRDALKDWNENVEPQEKIEGIGIEGIGDC